MTALNREKLIDSLFEQWRSNPNNICFSDWDLRTEIMNRLHCIKSNPYGTAIYLQDNDKRYLITAAHVIIEGD